eukprot:scaffold3608_cov183-Amphora_coffeaeformis.AAC.25
MICSTSSSSRRITGDDTRRQSRLLSENFLEIIWPRLGYHRVVDGGKQADRGEHHQDQGGPRGRINIRGGDVEVAEHDDRALACFLAAIPLCMNYD